MLTRTEINLVAERTAEIVIEKIEALIAVKTDEMLNAKQCAERIGISVGALYKRCETGRIPYHKKHGTVYFYKNEIQEYHKTDKPTS